MSRLVALLDELAAGDVDINTAGARAEDVTRGDVKRTPGGGVRVLRPMREVERDLADLQAAINALSPRDVKKWAGVFLMVRAQLGVGIANNAVSMLLRMSSETRGICPVGASPYVVAMFGATIDAIPADRTDVISTLLSARNVFFQ